MADLSLYKRGQMQTMADYQNANRMQNFNVQQQLLENEMARKALQLKMDAAASGKDLPSNIQEWNFYNQMNPDQKREYLKMKRATQLMDLGGQISPYDPLTNAPGASYQKTLTPEALPQTRAAQAAAVEGAKNRQEAVQNLPKVMQEGQYMLDLLDELEQHPGRTAVTGLQNPLKGQVPFFGAIPGTPAANFNARLDQLGGKQFMQAYETLKGGGQITEIEGMKATNAMARMQTAQSDDEFLAGLREFKQVVKDGLERARMKASSPAAQDPMQEFLGALGGMEELSPVTGDLNLYQRGEQEFNRRKMQKQGVVPASEYFK